MAVIHVFIGSDVEGYVRLDASEAENHRRESEITQYPIEEGANVSDHIRPKPIILSIYGIVSATPIPIDATAPSLTRVADARARLIKWRDSGTLVDVYTAKEVYRQLGIASLAEDVDWSNANDFEPQLTFQQVTTAAVAYIQGPTAKNPAAQNTVNAGTQATNAKETSALEAAWEAAAH